MDQKTKDYIAGLKTYHKELTRVVEENYDIKTQYLEVISWGYHTTAMYLKSQNDKEYLIKLTDWNPEKEEMVIKDIRISDKLRPVIPTPIYVPNNTKSYLTRYQDKILRLSHYISGLAPLDMNYDILGQMVEALKKVHTFNILHGDLTPHNVLVSHGRLVAVMDFELSFEGPVEYDLSRTAVFCWNYFGNEPFENVGKFILTGYKGVDINVDLFYKLCLDNAKKHLESVEKYRNAYDSEQKWNVDYEFAKKQYSKLTSLFGN